MPKQLTVLIENRPGALAQLTGALAEAGVNITSIMLEGSLEFGVARLHVNDYKKGRKALDSAGFQVQEGEVISLPLRNEPGALSEICDKLGEAQINIESIFGTTDSGDQPRLVIKVDDHEKAKDLLEV